MGAKVLVQATLKMSKKTTKANSDWGGTKCPKRRKPPHANTAITNNMSNTERLDMLPHLTKALLLQKVKTTIPVQWSLIAAAALLDIRAKMSLPHLWCILTFATMRGM